MLSKRKENALENNFFLANVFENALAEKSKSPISDKWLRRGIVLCIPFECSPSWICLVTLTRIT